MQRAGKAILSIYMGLLLIFLAAPIVIVVVVSFNPQPYVVFPPSGFSARWYLAVTDFLPYVVNSLKLAVLAAFGALILGVPAALAFGRERFIGQQVLESYLLSPLSLPLIVLGIALLFFYAAIGMGLSFSGLVAAHIVICIPYIVRTVAGVYRGLGRSLEEAAAVHGARPIDIFVHITLPLIKPGIVAAAIFSFLMSFDNVPVSIFLTQSDTTTLPVYLLSYLVYNFDPSIAAISTIELCFVIVALYFAERYYGLSRLGGLSQ